MTQNEILALELIANTHTISQYPRIVDLLYKIINSQSGSEEQNMSANCTWEEDDEGDWVCNCGNVFCLDDGFPHEKGMKFCCYCGRPLKEIRFKMI